MKIATVMGAFTRSPLLVKIEKRREADLRILALTGDDLAECATWGTACEPPDHLAPLRAPCLAGLCTVRTWQEAHVVAWADGQHAWICEVAR